MSQITLDQLDTALNQVKAPYLTEQQQAAWDRLFSLYELELARTNNRTDAMANAVRTLSIELLREKGKTAEAELQRLARKGVWAEDFQLAAVCQALGFVMKQTIIGSTAQDRTARKLLPTFIANDVANHTGLSIDLINQTGRYTHSKTARNGIHWRLKSEDNRGGGDCGVLAIAQQILKDTDHVFHLMGQKGRKLASAAEVQSLKNATVETQAAVASQKRPSTAEVQAEVTAQFQAHDAKAEGRRTMMAALLQNKSLAELATLFKVAQKSCEGDAFITNRSKEAGVDISAIIENNELELHPNLHQILLHALTTEAWRSAESSKAIAKAAATTSASTSTNRFGLFGGLGTDELDRAEAETAQRTQMAR